MNKTKQNAKKDGDTRGPYNEDVFGEFISWAVMTRKERQKCNLGSAKAFADRYDIHESQLSRWKLREDFQSQKQAKQREKLQELTPDILDAFFKRCIRYGMSNDVELWLALVEGWDKKKIIAQKPEIQFGPNDIRTLMMNLPKEKQLLYYRTLAQLIADAKQLQLASRQPC